MLKSLTLCNALSNIVSTTDRRKFFSETHGQKSYTWTEDLLSAMTARHGTFLEHNSYLYF